MIRNKKVENKLYTGVVEAYNYPHRSHDGNNIQEHEFFGVNVFGGNEKIVSLTVSNEMPKELVIDKPALEKLGIKLIIK